MSYITLDRDNIEKEHICCAISDKKCAESYELKKKWLSREFENGFIFRRLNERAKVFLEYAPAEKAWIPVSAPGYLMLGCFWVSGKYKGNGHGKALLQEAIDDARENAQTNDITNSIFVVGDIRTTLNDDFFSRYGQPDVIVTDPPRAGMHSDVIDTIKKAKPKRLVYISCNPATQARDLELLSDKYIIEEVQPLDMFPHTHHLENIVSLKLTN